jgi:hypothetical protein
MSATHFNPTERNRSDTSKLVLRRYTSRVLEGLETSDQLYFGQLVGPNLIRKPCVYLTVTKYLEALEARAGLAITYTPKFRYDLQLANPFTDHGFELISNLNAPVRSENDANAAPRVWPAWGNAGGARETILQTAKPIKVVAATLADLHELPGGGLAGDFVQDITQAYDESSLRAIGQGISEALRGSENRPQEFRVKQVEDGIVFAWGNDEILYSISLAYFADESHCAMRTWGYAWKDYEHLSVRRLFGPVVEDCWATRPPGQFPRSVLRSMDLRGTVQKVAARVLRSLTPSNQLSRYPFPHRGTSHVMLPSP